MKSNTGKYREVTELPENAKTVKQYAKDKGIDVSYVYKKVARGKNNDFEIVLFQGVNFVIKS